MFLESFYHGNLAVGEGIPIAVHISPDSRADVDGVGSVEGEIEKEGIPRLLPNERTTSVGREIVDIGTVLPFLVLFDIVEGSSRLTGLLDGRMALPTAAFSVTSVIPSLDTME